MRAAAIEAGPRPAARRPGRVLAGEILAVALLFVADAFDLVPLSHTPFLLAIGWASLRLRGRRWRDVGLSSERGWRIPLAAGVAGGAGIELFELFVSQPLLVRLTGEYPDLSVFQPLVGNVGLLMAALALTWTLAAFGEEMVWRGWILSRAMELLPAGRAARWGALALVSVAFGLMHAYQGPTGVIENALDGFLLGLIYLGTGRNLWAPILAHGFTDTVDFLLIFSGRYPGL